jgi:hypothetical protein
VTLKMKRSALLGTDPFTTLQNLYVDIRNPFFGSAATLAITDFQTGASRSAVGKFNPAASNGWYSATLSSLPLQWMSRTATTQFRLAFQTGDDNDATADAMRFFSGRAGVTADRPVLVVQYHRP